MRSRVVLACLCAFAVLLLAGAPHRASAGGALQPLITTSELAVGQNRFAFGLLKDGSLLADAEVIVRTYDLRGPEAQLVGESRATYYELEVIEQGRHVHVHPDGTRHVHPGATDVEGIYVAPVTFAHPGSWGVEILARRGGGPVEAARLSVNVLPASHTPAVGSRAPRSRNLVAADVRDLKAIDSSEPPDPRLHRIRIADAIAQGQPLLIVFATPRHCTSRVCGPVVDLVRTLIPAYAHRLAFVHQEIWQDVTAQTFTPTVTEWNLRSEPWIFLVDGTGTVRAKFEGLATRRELEAALGQMLRRE